MVDHGMKRKCACFIGTLKWTPVIFIMLVIGWSYYAYVVQLCVITISDVTQRIAFLVVYHILLFFFLWSYLRTIFANIGAIPDDFKLPAGDWEKISQAGSKDAEQQILTKYANKLPIVNRTSSGAIRFCEKCRIIKPDRAHHCSVCSACVLKMDHHCPWINNCVSFTNYKYFTLFLWYTLLYSFFIGATSVQYSIQFWKGDMEGMSKYHILFLFFAALLFFISLGSLCGYHLYLILRNRTTLEAFRPPIFRSGPNSRGYDLGNCSNIKQVFGDDPKLWPFPVWSSLGDGINYPLRPDAKSGNTYRSMDTTAMCLLHTEALLP